MSNRKLKKKCPCCGDFLHNKDGDVVCLKCGYEDLYYYIRRAEDEVPFCCEACGGPYPSCKVSCNLFDA